MQELAQRPGETINEIKRDADYECTGASREEPTAPLCRVWPGFPALDALHPERPFLVQKPRVGGEDDVRLGTTTVRLSATNALALSRTWGGRAGMVRFLGTTGHT